MTPDRPGKSLAARNPPYRPNMSRAGSRWPLWARVLSWLFLLSGLVALGLFIIWLGAIGGNW